MVDYSFHQIVTDATDDVVWKEIPQVVASGVRSMKVFLTYDPSHLDDRAFIRVLAAARRNGALVSVHCENFDAIRWRTEALLADGRRRRSIMPGRARAWSSVRPSIVPSRSPKWLISPYRSFTSPAPRWPRKSRGLRRAG